MKKSKIQPKLTLKKNVIIALDKDSKDEVNGGESYMTPCMTSRTRPEDTTGPITQMKCLSYYYVCGYQTWINCAADNVIDIP
ncbi:class I lanthipeptide [Taibaiella koreensis]|uniref:class I lanthipeptide n=1 Tax=Taibaiella koreensis TaxID=1268548 RepID=UPI000E59C29B|nr:class I lanthipeptide [Taibaiella koreensis]